MEKQFNREDRLMKKLLNEAGTEKPSGDFKKKIMMRVEARNATITPYEPLISKSAWITIGIAAVLSIAGLSYLYADISLANHIDFEFLRSLKIPKLDLSRNMQIAIAFVALFFLQIPFLKRLMDREYRF